MSWRNWRLNGAAALPSARSRWPVSWHTWTLGLPPTTGALAGHGLPPGTRLPPPAHRCARPSMSRPTEQPAYQLCNRRGLMMSKLPQQQIPGVYHRRVGDIVVTALSDGFLDGSLDVL